MACTPSPQRPYGGASPLPSPQPHSHGRLTRPPGQPRWPGSASAPLRQVVRCFWAVDWRWSHQFRGRSALRRWGDGPAGLPPTTWIRTRTGLPRLRLVSPGPRRRRDLHRPVLRLRHLLFGDFVGCGQVGAGEERRPRLVSTVEGATIAEVP